jgi:presenilin-like A22 family membrane protease
MREEQRLVALLLASFLGVQAFGLYLGWKLVTAAGIVPETSAQAGAGIFIYILVATVFILAIIKYFRKALKALEILSILFSTFVFFSILFFGVLPDQLADYAAIGLAIGITALRVAFPGIITQNASILLSIIGVGALLGASLGVLPALILLGLLSIYDVIAVFKTKHMVTMAKEITKQQLAFTMAIPTRKHTFQLGGGDLVMPLIFTVAVLREFGVGVAVATMASSMLALTALFAFILRTPGKAYPALPPVTIGALLGFSAALAAKVVLNA